MRHLLAQHDHYYVVGFSDRAFLGFESPGDDETKAAVVELLPSLDPKTIENSAPLLSKAAATSLDPSPSPTTDIKNKKQGPQESVNTIHVKEKEAEKQLNEICAVAIINDNEDMVNESSDTIILRCAVARNNKSLDVYTVKIDKSPPDLIQSPSLSYRTPKRVSCFAFASIDVPASESTLKSTKKPLLISGDVAGDSYAYNLLEKGERLLLGHTASMLTDIAIVKVGESQSDENCLLLTSDRDEKIRLSRFPESHLVEGFLLGHTAYVTGFAVISSPSPLVVSCGGDMTLRLWDLAAQNEIFCASLAICTSDDGTNNEKNRIPTSIAVSSCGSFVALIFDDSMQLSVYKIIIAKSLGEDVQKKSLEFLCSIDCPSQPLCIAFREFLRVRSSLNGDNTGIVLTVSMKDPDYIATYYFNHYDQDGVKPLALARNDNLVIRAMRSIALEEKIVMPCTILEKDDYGNPVLQKENETRGPAAAEAPWNRVERIEIAKEREKRRKKKPKLAKSS